MDIKKYTLVRLLWPKYPFDCPVYLIVLHLRAEVEWNFGHFQVIISSASLVKWLVFLIYILLDFISKGPTDTK